jgi:nucleotide-binding universal stress UspA family protein
MSDTAILLAYDDSEPAQRALRRAASLAKALGSNLVVASVAPVTTAASGRSIGTDPTETSADHLAELSTARTYLNGEGVTAEFIEALGHPADAILDAARERNVDLIVLGSRHLSLVQRLLGQSVSDAVSHGASCDVLIVH